MKDKKTIMSAVRQYWSSVEAFRKSSTDLGNACDHLRSVAGVNRKVVILLDSKSYLLTTDSGGDFDVQEIVDAVDISHFPHPNVEYCSAEKIDAIDSRWEPC